MISVDCSVGDDESVDDVKESLISVEFSSFSLEVLSFLLSMFSFELLPIFRNYEDKTKETNKKKKHNKSTHN